MLLLAFIFVVAVGIRLAFLIQGAPYVRSTASDVEQILTLAKTCKPKRLLDMGSGDGTVVIALARAGYRVDGVELNPYLVWRSRRAITRAGLGNVATIYRASFWGFDVSSYDIVVVYGISHIMARLEVKFQAELTPGSHIISNYFAFPALHTVRKLSRAKLYRL